MGFWSDMLEDISQEPWTIPAQPKSADFLYFRGSTTKSISTYRLVIASYWSVWIAISILGSVGVKFPAFVFGDLDNDFDVKWLIFLTNWSMVLLGTYLWTAFAASMHTDHSPLLLKVVWVLRNCTGKKKTNISLVHMLLIIPACVKRRCTTGLIHTFST